MRDDPRSITFRRILCWVILPLMWGAPALLHFAHWRAGLITDERYWGRYGFLLMMIPIAIAMPFVEAWKASRPKPPPVYRSTILD